MVRGQHRDRQDIHWGRMLFPPRRVQQSPVPTIVLPSRVWTKVLWLAENREKQWVAEISIVALHRIDVARPSTPITLLEDEQQPVSLLPTQRDSRSLHFQSQASINEPEPRPNWPTGARLKPGGVNK